METLDVRPIAGALGAEIHGVDLRDPRPDLVAALRAARLDHMVVFFRDQTHEADQFL